MIAPGPFTVSMGVGVADGSEVDVEVGVSVSVEVGAGVNVAVAVAVLVGVGVSVAKNAETTGVEQPVKRKKANKAGGIHLMLTFDLPFKAINYQLAVALDRFRAPKLKQSRVEFVRF